MKVSFVVTLFALCLCAGAAELPYLGNALSFRKHRGVLTTDFDASSGQVSNVVSEHNSSHPYLRIDYEYKRAGTVSISHYGVSVEKCIQLCYDSDSCLAVNYDHYTWICHELETFGGVTPQAGVSTCLVNYKDGDDPCDEKYFVKSHVRAGFYYEVFHGTKAESAKNCCMKCKEDPESRCVIWSFRTKPNTCFLQAVAGTLKSSSAYTTGFSVVVPQPPSVQQG